jgi:hypothetical protein
MSRQTLKRLVITSVVVVVIVLLGIWLFVDVPAPDDADLRITYGIIPTDENAFTYFNRAGQELLWTTSAAGKRRLRDLETGKDWDDALAVDVLAQNEGVLELIEQGLACPRCQLPEVRRYDDLLPYLAPWRTVAWLGAIRAEHLFRQGQEGEALDQAMRIMRFGHTVEHGRGSIVSYLVGIAIKKIGRHEFVSIVSRCTLGPDDLLPYVRQLGRCRASEDGLADAFRVEYVVAANTIDDMASGKYSVDDSHNRSFAGLGPVFLKPNRTKRRMAETIRLLIASTQETRATATLPEFEQEADTRWRIRAILSGNLVGRNFYRMIVPALESGHAAKCAENCSVAATQILVALKCYRLEHGELPESLDEVVPEYLEAVPLDDFDGRPMKYSREKRLVYAVGPDLTDNGGKSETRWHWAELVPDNGYDLVYTIAF